MTITDTAAAAAIEAAARELKLPIVRTDAARLADDAQRSKLTYLAFLADILEAEVDARTERRRTRRIHDARFPRIKRLAEFDLDAAPTIEPATIATLAAGHYWASPETVEGFCLGFERSHGGWVGVDLGGVWVQRIPVLGR